jgi:hypothetical protein
MTITASSIPSRVELAGLVQTTPASEEKRTLTALAAVATLGSLLFGYDTGVIAGALPCLETGAFGYFSTDPAALRTETKSRRLVVVAGVQSGVLHHEEAWSETETAIRANAEVLLAAVDARHLRTGEVSKNV